MKRILTLALGATFALTSFAELDHIDLRGVDYTVDTLFHAKVGPGTTQTQLRLEGPSPLNVFYLTVDVSTPGVSIRTVIPYFGYGYFSLQGRSALFCRHQR